MSKKQKNSGQLSFDLQSDARSTTINCGCNTRDGKKGGHLTVVASNLCTFPVKMNKNALTPYSPEITRIIRAKGKALGW